MTNKTTSAIDLVERLRAIDPLEFDFSKDTNTLDEAADTITRLQAALLTARGALRSVVEDEYDSFYVRAREALTKIDAALSVGGE